ncbi:T9SS type A sorting domain-containing protein [Aequorivita lipolytica]|uniref:T9SS type A sorting domain-containing protein n=1 Tax=Aequorivita lipolytica TaxID=153267 RepID=A0A5C6YT50_9FLAO|nr:T9SS type A sorting domain-containing protein [Aequorivita lipolytica]TXD70632.1 T9SS type A sorting domain-containing protein [Aequorivita lipolytica]SRX49665.1 hypothetical protein AEQU2_00128 [Aequorivita lipolytica]
MKTLLYFLAFSLSALSFAQDPQLFDNTWYLQKINIDGVNYQAPQNSEIDFIQLNIYQDVFDTIVCLGLSGYQLTISNTDINVFEFIILPDDPCVLPENNDFENLYYNGFFEWQSTNKTFAYIIEGQGSDLSLVLTSDLGNKAFYGNQPLATPNFSASQFSVHPNPAKNRLYINTTNPTANLKIKILNIEGKLLSTQNTIFEKQVSINVSNLSNGIYFLNIEEDDGRVETKKFIKE